ncbi:YadA family autotransporter adhesin [Oligella urethralis]|uniref:YadA family autotransporter adhesin n=1 Tax=Oligella urethralis TaxID=90245 RepID=UPI000DFCC768|nr:YadA family autotransporter adhesin [Oligella urethralis]SUA56003.1 YadA-like C-terminal region [Oligella urethralis]
MGSFSSAKGRGFYKNALLVSVALAIFPLSAEAVSDSRRIGPIVIYSSAALAPFVVGRGHYANVADERLGNTIPYTSGILTVQGSKTDSNGNLKNWSDFDMGENIMTKIDHKPYKIEVLPLFPEGHFDDVYQETSLRTAANAQSHAASTPTQQALWDNPVKLSDPNTWTRFPELSAAVETMRTFRRFFDEPEAPAIIESKLPYQSIISYLACSSSLVPGCQDEQGNFKAPDKIVFPNGYGENIDTLYRDDLFEAMNPELAGDGPFSLRQAMRALVYTGEKFKVADTGEEIHSLKGLFDYLLRKENKFFTLGEIDYGAIGGVGHPPYDVEPYEQLVPGDTTINVAMKKTPSFDGIVIRPPEEGGAGINMGGNKITNLVPGTDDMDAVNVSQLKQVETTMTNQVTQLKHDFDRRLNDTERRLGRRADAGTATALAVAGLPQAFIPGKSLVALGTGSYGSQVAFAAGISRISDNGKWILKGSVSTATHGHVGANAMLGYQW